MITHSRKSNARVHSHSGQPSFFFSPWQSHVRLGRSVGLGTAKRVTRWDPDQVGRKPPVHRGSVGHEVFQGHRRNHPRFVMVAQGCRSQFFTHIHGVAKTPAKICQQFLLACAADLLYNEHGISIRKRTEFLTTFRLFHTKKQPYSKVGRTCCPNPCRHRTEWRDAVHRQAERPETWKQDSVDMSGMSLRDTRSKDNFITCYVLSSNHHSVSRECLDLGQYRP